MGRVGVAAGHGGDRIVVLVEHAQHGLVDLDGHDASGVAVADLHGLAGDLGGAARGDLSLGPNRTPVDLGWRPGRPEVSLVDRVWAWQSPGDMTKGQRSTGAFRCEGTPGTVSVVVESGSPAALARPAQHRDERNPRRHGREQGQDQAQPGRSGVQPR